MKKSFGQRICIVGPGSTGKSTLAVALGRELGLAVHHLDQFHHYPTGNWIARPREEYLALHDAAIAGDKWVIEGNYTLSMSQRFARADTIIVTDMNRFGCLWRFVKRHFRDVRNPGSRVGSIEAPQEKFNWHMVWWIMQPKMLSRSRNAKLKKQRELFKEHEHKIIRINSFRDTQNLLKEIQT